MEIESFASTAVAPSRWHRPQESTVSDYVWVQRADNQAMAELIKQRLDDAGIPCVLVESGIAAYAGAGGAYAVTVPAKNAEEARKLLGE
jgi:hypothetical protein